MYVCQNFVINGFILRICHLWWDLFPHDMHTSLLQAYFYFTGNLDDDCGWANPVETKPQFPCKNSVNSAKTSFKLFHEMTLLSCTFEFRKTAR